MLVGAEPEVVGEGIGSSGPVGIGPSLSKAYVSIVSLKYLDGLSPRFGSICFRLVNVSNMY